MCRSKDRGGRRCPCCRGDRRRAYQRLRYALQKAEQNHLDPTPPDNPDDPSTDSPPSTQTGPDLEQRRLDTAHTLDTALAAYRANPRGATPQVIDAYAGAVIAHGAALRDLALHQAEQNLQHHGLDDTAAAARAAAIAQNIKRLDDEIAATRARAATGVTDADSAAATVDELARTKAQLVHDAFRESQQMNQQRAEIVRDAYYRVLADERSFGTAETIPINAAKMSRADRAMFTAAIASYPDEMVKHANELGDMLAKRSKAARAHYNAAKPQKRRRTRTEVLDLSEALDHGRLTPLRSYFVDSPEAMASGNGTTTDLLASKYATIPRTPDNERRLAELITDFNDGRTTTQARMEFATKQGANGPEEVIYVRGTRTRTTMVTVGVAAEITYSDAPSMIHELAHRMEDRNPEISFVTKHFLHQRTAGQPKERYYKNEWTTPDGFADRYMGKDYPNTHHTELLSCGMEAITHGRFGGLRGQASIDLNNPDGKSAIETIIPLRADPEHLALVLGILAAANKP
ncbi:hypothetical protein BKN37_21070 [Mycobacterium talmoniae]|uniref:Uncharacterized protein n=1 Tax=Mycobacterium talmoniae TaxID=1858794 RepID=A0A1S1NET2_9MYCO|nr:hypothetical protein BKN37_21070 [Mycobacterium talmoniae]